MNQQLGNFASGDLGKLIYESCGRIQNVFIQVDIAEDIYKLWRLGLTGNLYGKSVRE